MEEFFEFEKHGKNYVISTKNDPYGISFWHNFISMNYEPDTQALMQVFCNQKTLFMDVGAANGSMTILAASLGARVWAYEPNPDVFQSLYSNVHLNPSLVGNVELINKPVSNSNGFVGINTKSLSDILTPIVFTRWSLQTSLEVVSLVDEIQRCRESNPECEIVIKMDIEGAEWKLLSDNKVLQTLQKEKVVLILALHPGLQRPIRYGNSLLFRLLSITWNFRNLIDTLFLYSRLCKLSVIKRTNLNVVRRKTHFCLLVLGGNHEFIVDFKSKAST